MDSHAVSYTTPSRRNSSRTYQDLAAYHANGHSWIGRSSYIMEEIIKVSLLRILLLCLTSICTLIHRSPGTCKIQVPVTPPFSMLTSTASHSLSCHASPYWHCWRRHFWFTLCRYITSEWLSSDHAGRTGSSGWSSPPNICSQYGSPR